MCFFTRQFNPRPLGSWCVKVTDRRIHSGSGLSGSIAHHDPNDLGMIYLVKKRKTIFGLLILSDLRIQSWIFLKCHCDEISHFFFPLFFTQNNLPSCTMSFRPERKKLKRFPLLNFRRSKSEILRPPLLESGSS